MSESGLIHRARRAYELGRIRTALAYAALAVPLAALSHSCCIDALALWLLCAAAFAAIAASVWRGRALGAGARAGLVAGLLSWLLPLAARWLGLPMTGAAVPLCFGAGLASGVVVAWQAGRREEGRAWFLAAAAVVAGLIGGLGCIIAGAGGLLGMVAGEVIAAVPVVAFARRST